MLNVEGFFIVCLVFICEAEQMFSSATLMQSKQKVLDVKPKLHEKPKLKLEKSYKPNTRCKLATYLNSE